MKYNLPNRRFCAGPKKMVSMRLPEDLMNEIRTIAKLKGWEVTDLVMTVLDQFAQGESKNSAKK